MNIKTLKNCLIWSEHDDLFNADWFNYKDKSYISHVDTFYFLVYPKCDDWTSDERKLNFMEVLNNAKNLADSERKSQPIFTELFQGLEVVPYMGFQMYSFHFGLKDNFDVFVCNSLPNEKTPPILIQIRSQALWLDGLKGSFDYACSCVEKILGFYGIEILKVQENRIDYAFHTNYIQDLINFFPIKNLNEMQVSNFMRWHEEGFFYNNEIGADYFTLGRRKSNNVFFRVYNKSKEVIEMGYKQFFIPIWLDNGLISKFDEYVLKKAFVYGSYFSKDKARCEFYYDYGSDYSIKKDIYDKLQDKDTPLRWYSERAKGLVPDITIVSNIEFQTKRKFYARLEMPNLINDKSYKFNVYNLFEQMKCIIDFLTDKTLRFVRYKGKYKEIARIDRPIADWWQRLRSSKPLEYSNNWIIDYFRTYQHNLDIERQKTMSINKLASLSAYMKFSDEDTCSSTIINDIYEFTNSLNDNDVIKYYNAKDAKFKELCNSQKQDYLEKSKLCMIR